MIQKQCGMGDGVPGLLPAGVIQYGVVYGMTHGTIVLLFCLVEFESILVEVLKVFWN
jgi:hypothetical protein